MNQPALNLVVLRSPNPGRSVSFYETLGLAFTRHRHGNGPEHFAAELGGMVFEIYPLEPGGTPSVGARIGFCIPSMDRVVQAVAALPGAIVSPPKASPWGLRAVLQDPDGHRVELIERQTPPAPPAD